MTLYARSDVMSVALSKDHGGCGATHSRPVTHGAPNKVWVLDCIPCEDHLRSDPHWAMDATEIPETPDETRIRENAEKKGENAQRASMENAVASLAATADGFQKLMMMMFASNPDMAANMTKVMGALAAASDRDLQNAQNVIDHSDDPTPADGLEILKSASEGAKSAEPSLDDLKLPELRDLCRQQGLSASGNRDELIKRLRG